MFCFDVYLVRLRRRVSCDSFAHFSGLQRAACVACRPSALLDRSYSFGITNVLDNAASWFVPRSWQTAAMASLRANIFFMPVGIGDILPLPRPARLRLVIGAPLQLPHLSLPDALVAALAHERGDGSASGDVGVLLSGRDSSTRAAAAAAAALLPGGMDQFNRLLTLTHAWYFSRLHRLHCDWRAACGYATQRLELHPALPEKWRGTAGERRLKQEWCDAVAAASAAIADARARAEAALRRQQQGQRRQQQKQQGEQQEQLQSRLQEMLELMWAACFFILCFAAVCWRASLGM